MIEKFNNVFFKKKQAYRRVFNPDSPDVQIVLADLQKVCRGRGTKYMGDIYQTHIMIGQNNIWERIQSYINIPDSTLAKLTEHDTDD